MIHGQRKIRGINVRSTVAMILSIFVSCLSSQSQKEFRYITLLPIDGFQDMERVRVKFTFGNM